MPPKDWTELLIWLAMQFPVLGVCVVVVRWVLRWTANKHEAEMKRTDELNARLLAEKETRIAEGKERVKELKAEIEELKKKLSRTPTRDKADKEKADEGGTKP